MALDYRSHALSGVMEPPDDRHCTSSDTFVAERGQIARFGSR